MIPELEIYAYRLLFTQMFPLPNFQPKIGNREMVYKDLTSFMPRLKAFKKVFESNRTVENGKFILLQEDLKDICKRYFSTPIIDRLFPKEKPLSYGTPIAAAAVIRDVIGILSNNVLSPAIEQFYGQYKEIEKMLSCIKDFGLHDGINKRDKKEWLYNVVIEVNANHKIETEFRDAMKEEEMISLVLKKYIDHKPISINGRRIPVNKIDRLTITSTPLRGEEIQLYRTKEKIRTDLDFVLRCKNVTNELLDKFEALLTPIDDGKSDSPKNEIPFIGNLIINNLNISKVVLDAYYGMVPQPLSREEVAANYVGSLSRYNAPFRVQIYEAYPLMTYWEFLELEIEEGYFQKKGISDKEMQDIHLKAYSDGFVKGYFSFESEFLAQKTSLFNDPEDRLRFIYDLVRGKIFPFSGFPETIGGGRSVLSGYPKAGKEAGWFYRAWYLILENSHRFEAMFKEGPTPEFDFIARFGLAIETLQRTADQQKFIRDLKAGISKDESEFRNFIRNNLEGNDFEFIESEGAHGLKRTDLRAKDKQRRTHIVEFKGWWNTKDRKLVPSQVVGYLTDFEKSGYVFMVNHLKTDILSAYKKNVEHSDNNYVEGSWEVRKLGNTDFEYYVSRHQKHNRPKTVYHFIFRVYP